MILGEKICILRRRRRFCLTFSKFRRTKKKFRGTEFSKTPTKLHERAVVSSHLSTNNPKTSWFLTNSSKNCDFQRRGESRISVHPSCRSNFRVKWRGQIAQSFLKRMKSSHCNEWKEAAPAINMLVRLLRKQQMLRYFFWGLACKPYPFFLSRMKRTTARTTEMTPKQVKIIIELR